MPKELDSPLQKTFSDSFKKSTLNPTFLHIAEDELHETPENYKQQLKLLHLLVANDKNLALPNDDDFFIRFLRAKKFDSQKAFHMLQRYYIMKLKFPELFRCPLPSELSRILNYQAQNMLINRDQFGRRVYIIRKNSTLPR